MAVFLINQCTFSKLPNVNNVDQQQQTSWATMSNGASQSSNQNSNDSTSSLGAPSVGVVGLSPTSNICGLKFDSLLELIHHIEDNHITDVDYPGVTGPFYNGQQTVMNSIYSGVGGAGGVPVTGGTVIAPGPQPGLVGGAGGPPPMRDSNIYNVIPHDRHHMTQIINGGWLPTSCILRIFNSTHKPLKQQPHQPMSVDMVQQSQQQQQQQICSTPNMDNNVNAHHIILSSPKIVGNMNGTSYHVSSGAITASQTPNVTAVTPMSSAPPNQAIYITQPQPLPPQQQQINVNNSIQPQQQIQLQQQPPPQQPQLQLQPQQQPPTPTPTPSQQQQQPHQQHPPTVQTPTTIPKPTKVYKCSDCSKTYKTQHGLRSHQGTHHPNSPQTDGKAMAMMLEGGDTPSGSPADLPQQQQQQPQHQPLTVDMVQQSQQQQICSTPNMDNNVNAHHIILSSPKIVGNMNGTSYHVSSGAITASQTPNVTAVTPMSSAPPNQAIYITQPQPLPPQQQQINVNSSIQPQQQVQLQQQPPSQQPQLQLQTQQQPPPPSPLASSQQQHPPTAPTPTTIPKPTKVYKCSDCSKTYKTQHGLRSHQGTHHPNSPQTDGKAMAIMPEGGDTPSGSPADLPQQQNKIPQQ